MNKRILFVTLLFILTYAVSLAAQLANYTLADVAKHNNSSDCWIILNKTEVYNVTPFLSIHPAGAGPITPFCGADATAAFNAVGHSSGAVSEEATYLIGNLVSSAISVTISPTTATLTTGQQQTFVANVSGSTKGVTWTATSVGTIDQNGVYTAVSAGTGTVTATSVEDTTKSATAQVTISTAGGGGGGGISVKISPANTTLSVGSSQQFTANVTGSNSGVTWTATGAVGTIDAKGMFTATKAGMGVVKATAVGDPTKSASANVAVSKSTTAGCSLVPIQSGFSISCSPNSAIPVDQYRCVGSSDAKSTVVRCTISTGGGHHGGGGDD
jgi:uncharacterized protein YjdB